MYALARTRCHRNLELVTADMYRILTFGMLVVTHARKPAVRAYDVGQAVLESINGQVLVHPLCVWCSAYGLSPVYLVIIG